MINPTHFQETFPLEMSKEIFNHLDLRGIIQMQSVCKTLNNFVHDYLQENFSHFPGLPNKFLAHIFSYLDFTILTRAGPVCRIFNALKYYTECTGTIAMLGEGDDGNYYAWVLAGDREPYQGRLMGLLPIVKGQFKRKHIVRVFINGPVTGNYYMRMFSVPLRLPYTTQTCSQCGHQRKKELSER